MNWETRSESAAIVLLGSFNPRIFHPEWFIRKELVPEWDYRSLEAPLLTSKEASQFNLPNEGTLQVLPSRFMVNSPSASEQLALQDLVISTFSILSETPITKMGMNYEMVVKIADQRAWRDLGIKLAPQGAWLEAARMISENAYRASDDNKQMLDAFGLWDMTMHLPRPDDLAGFLRAKIEIIPPQSNLQLKLSMNDHVELGQEDGAKEVSRILESHWSNSIDNAKKFFSTLLSTLV